MARFRNLTPQEVADARPVFRDTVPYERIQISDIGSGGAVTLAGRGLTDSRFVYTICWGSRVFELGVQGARQLHTLIHELTHVWQGENGIYPTFYMAQSVGSQLKHGVGDAIDKRDWRGFVKNWGEHRNTTYIFRATDIGKDWSSFNVEQQASIVESWWIAESDREDRGLDFGPGVTGGGASEEDARFPYIRDVVRGRNRRAKYVKPPTARAAAVTPLPPGADAQIKAMQDKLVALGYLDARHADGTIGRSHSATLDAVSRFQQHNGLCVDRDLGGSHSATRQKLALPIERLVRAR